jgi:hypothetical protein
VADSCSAVVAAEDHLAFAAAYGYLEG